MAKQKKEINFLLLLLVAVVGVLLILRVWTYATTKSSPPAPTIGAKNPQPGDPDFVGPTQFTDLQWQYVNRD